MERTSSQLEMVSLYAKLSNFHAYKRGYAPLFMLLFPDVPPIPCAPGSDGCA